MFEELAVLVGEVVADHARADLPHAQVGARSTLHRDLACMER